MKAATLDQFGSIDNLQIKNISIPKLIKGQVLVEVHGSSINPIDEFVLEGKLSKTISTLPIVPGSDLAGTVKEVADGQSGLKPGDHVYGQASVLNGGTGAMAEYALAIPENLAKMPDNLSFVEAGAIPLTGASAVQALYDHIKLKKGQKILIHGGSGGIGSIAIQIAKCIGAQVAATATGEGINFAKKIGANEVIDYKKENFEDKLTDFDAVLDTIGGDVYQKSFEVLKKGGIIVTLKEKAPHKDLEEKYGVKSVYQFTLANKVHLDKLRDLVEKGAVKVYIDKTFPLSEVEKGYKVKKEKQVLGKIAIEV